MSCSENNVIEFASRASKQESCAKPKLFCLIDSEAGLLNVVNRLVSNYEIRTFSTIFNALQSLKNEIPAGVIVQLHLKDENCFDFLRMLSSNPTFSHIPTITCCVADVFDKNIEDYLVKVASFMGSHLYISCAEFYSPALDLKVALGLDSKIIPLAS
jgi:response regulator RpfG family c-di-GMP phosphodiesterase